MATLQGTKVKDTYLGLLKTSDAGAFTSSLKTIQDGGGNDSALQLSTSDVKVEALKITSPSVTTDTNILTWNATTKTVGYKSISTDTSVTVSHDVTTASAPDLEITDNLGTTVVTGFRAGTNMSVTGVTVSGGATFTYNCDVVTISDVDSAGTLPSSSTGKLQVLDLSGFNSGGVITLPSAVTGHIIEFVIEDSSSTPVHIQPASGDTFKGRAFVLSTTDNTTSVQVSSAGTSDRIRLDSDSPTTGGSVGDRIRCVALSSSLWMVDAYLTTTSSSLSSVTTFTTQAAAP